MICILLGKCGQSCELDRDDKIVGWCEIEMGIVAENAGQVDIKWALVQSKS